EQLYITYIERGNFNIQGKEKQVGMGGGQDPYAAEVLHGSFSIYNDSGIKWTETALHKILSKLESWWNSDKHYLVDEKYKAQGFGSSVYEEFEQRFRNLTHIVARVYGSHKEVLKDKSILDRIITLINDMGE